MGAASEPGEDIGLACIPALGIEAIKRGPQQGLERLSTPHILLHWALSQGNRDQSSAPPCVSPVKFVVNEMEDMVKE